MNALLIPPPGSHGLKCKCDNMNKSQSGLRLYKGGVFSKVKMKSRNGHDFKETANVSNFVEIVLVSC